MNHFLQLTLTDQTYQAFQATIPPQPEDSPELIQSEDTLTRVSCAVSGTIEAFLPTAGLTPVLKLGENSAYIRSAKVNKDL